MKRKDYRRLDNPIDAVMIPIEKDENGIPFIPHPKNYFLVAFDIEDYGVPKVKVREKEEPIHYEERIPVAITCAFYVNGERKVFGEEMKQKWSFDELIYWITKKMQESGVHPLPKKLFLLTHFSIAELRNLRDWMKLRGKSRVQEGKGKYLHYRLHI